MRTRVLLSTQQQAAWKGSSIQSDSYFALLFPPSPPSQFFFFFCSFCFEFPASALFLGTLLLPIPRTLNVGEKGSGRGCHPFIGRVIVIGERHMIRHPVARLGGGSLFLDHGRYGNLHVCITGRISKPKLVPQWCSIAVVVCLMRRPPETETRSRVGRST